MTTTQQLGLSSVEVKKRFEAGLYNKTGKKPTKSYGRIVFDNAITFFNIITFCLFGLLIFVQSYKNVLFIGVVLMNIVIGIIQEVRSKQIIDKLSILTDVKAKVIRDGTEQEIATADIVKDDIVILKAGSQIVVDAKVLESHGLEVDESLLTGESDTVVKKPEDKLLSGSFVVSGYGIAQAEKVGEESYAASLTSEIRKHKRAHSEILTSINKIIKFMSVIILPVGALLFLSGFFISHQPLATAITSMVGAMVGMIPIGLVLLTTIAFTLGIIRIAAHRTLVQELPGLEVLARVDTLCLDKTGTLTEGTLDVHEAKLFDEASEKEVKKTFSNLLSCFKDENATAKALKEWSAQEQENAQNENQPMPKNTVPFSSERKWSLATFEIAGKEVSYIMGAPEMILKNGHEQILDSVNEFAGKGYRVILLAKSDNYSATSATSDAAENISWNPMALMLITDRIKSDAKKTLEYFASQDVDVKIISGDNPVLVSNVGTRLGLIGAEKFIDMSTVDEDASENIFSELAKENVIFGRVSPKQKQMLVIGLKASGKTVAMTGDGVNDVLALREADCGIAMASGSDATKGVAQIVLIDSDFKSLPKVLDEGRRVINNIEKVTSLYLVKTIFSLLLAILFIIIGSEYIFSPINLTVIGSITVGIPSFILALEGNFKRVTPGFFHKILAHSVPGSVAIFFVILLLLRLGNLGYLNPIEVKYFAVAITGFIGIMVLYRVSCPVFRPFNILRTIVLVGTTGLFIAALSVSDLWDVTRISGINNTQALIFAGMIIASYLFIIILEKIIDKQK
jgi:cation-transporting ATPase E